MAIINMAQNEEDARARGVNVRSVDANNDGKIIVWLYDSHVGHCLVDFERNGRDDSDFYMKVWNPEKREVETIEFASTRGWSYPCYGSRPDATPEVLAAANQREREMQLESFIAHDKAAARRPQPGRTVRVVKGRKLPVGTLCMVRRVENDGYKRVGPFGSALPGDYAKGGYTPCSAGMPQRVLLKQLDENGVAQDASPLEWVAEGNLEVLDPETYETPAERLATRCHDVYFPAATK